MTDFLRYIEKISAYLLICLIILTAFSSACPAYFSAKIVKKSTNTVIAHNNSTHASFSHRLVWFDNDKIHMHFSPNSDNYLYAFSMPIIELVAQQREMLIPSEFSIDNLLYANIELERLINEYNGLKDKSRSVLEGLDVPFIRQKSGFGFSPTEKDSADATISSNISTLDNRIRILAGPVFSEHKTGHGLNHFSPQINQQHDKRKPLHTLNQSSNQPLGKPLYKYRSLAKPDKFKAKAEKKQSLPNQRVTNDQLPLIERLGQSLINYVKQQRTELFIFFILILGLYYIFIGTRN